MGVATAKGLLPARIYIVTSNGETRHNVSWMGERDEMGEDRALWIDMALQGTAARIDELACSNMFPISVLVEIINGQPWYLRSGFLATPAPGNCLQSIATQCRVRPTRPPGLLPFAINGFYWAGAIQCNEPFQPLLMLARVEKHAVCGIEGILATWPQVPAGAATEARDRVFLGLTAHWPPACRRYHRS